MEKIKDFISVLDALKNRQCVVIQSPVETKFLLNANKITVKTDNAHYDLSSKEFELLFKHSIFYYFEDKQNFEIEALKDEEYYAWKHK